MRIHRRVLCNCCNFHTLIHRTLRDSKSRSLYFKASVTRLKDRVSSVCIANVQSLGTHERKASSMVRTRLVVSTTTKGSHVSCVKICTLIDRLLASGVVLQHA
jgi:hypothetical protein